MEPRPSSATLEAVQTAFERIADLPFPIYATDRQGKFLFANAEAMRLLQIEDKYALYAANITQYYADPQERETLLVALSQGQPDAWQQNLRVRLRISGSDRQLRYTARPFFNEDGRLAAKLCIANAVNDLEWFHELEEINQAGFFELDAQLNIEYCNKAFAKALNYDSPAQLKGKNLRDMAWANQQAEHLLKKLQEFPRLEDRRFYFRAHGGFMVIAEINCIGITNAAGSIDKIKGTIKDITFDSLTDELPIGLFLVTTNAEGKEIISRANPKMAEIYGYGSPGELLTLPVTNFHLNESTYADYKKRLDREADQGRALMNHFMEIRTLQGEKRNLVANVRYIDNTQRRLRVGAVYDLTDHVGKHLHTLESDFSAILHTYIATINGLRDTMIALIQAHGQDMLKGEHHIDAEKITNGMSTSKKLFGEQLRDLQNIAYTRDIPNAILVKINKLWDVFLSGKLSAEGERANSAFNRKLFIQLRRELQALRSLQALPREQTRILRTELDNLQRLTSLVSLSIAVDEIKERLPDFHFFREYLGRGEVIPQEFTKQDLMPIFLQVIQSLEEFAALNKVSVVQHFNPKDSLMVRCHRSSINRALHSLLHNAIKYSWTKGTEKSPWVDVRIEKKPREIVISIQNWGVPIRKEELDSGLVFEFGKRGRLSDDRNRSGTGIGLYDAQDILEKHGGQLRLTSEPILGNPAYDYSRPFITTVYITLPIEK
jgi:PAS domain S-box-containing protein